jgi:hypothetical protein
MAGKSPRWEVGDMVLFERWQNPSNLLGETLFADHMEQESINKHCASNGAVH